MHDAVKDEATQREAHAYIPVSLVSQGSTWGPLALVCAGIFWFSSQPSLGEPNALLTMFAARFGDTDWFERYQTGLQALDAASSWMAHFGEYALLALAAFWAIHRQWPGHPRPYLLALAIAAVYALSDEAHQYFVPGRHADWRDVATDWMGAGVALTFLWLWRRRRKAALTALP